ncbi:chemotaxis protein [Shewanella sp. NIFS-20-20]|uniref:chemotaxis protein n=1 Tax=Shewanella sp. NIFS-20-20 TaxID=2853806 RepID=UPI001C455E6B|nr:chemotaxis protein [Shewanella sp. NIFS-20-20]MBV7316362.1 chemotaxis protein [Shewanella sp. NIFS-20-20]
MQISSATQSGISGLQNAQSSLNQATVDVAKPQQPPAQVNAESSDNPNSTTQTQSPDKVSALVDAKQAANQGQAAAEVIEAENEALGSIINISV